MALAAPSALSHECCREARKDRNMVWRVIALVSTTCSFSPFSHLLNQSLSYFVFLLSLRAPSPLWPLTPFRSLAVPSPSPSAVLLSDSSLNYLVYLFQGGPPTSLTSLSPATSSLTPVPTAAGCSVVQELLDENAKCGVNCLITNMMSGPPSLI